MLNPFCLLLTICWYNMTRYGKIISSSFYEPVSINCIQLFMTVGRMRDQSYLFVPSIILCRWFSRSRESENKNYLNKWLCYARLYACRCDYFLFLNFNSHAFVYETSPSQENSAKHNRPRKAGIFFCIGFRSKYTALVIVNDYYVGIFLLEWSDSVIRRKSVSLSSELRPSFR